MNKAALGFPISKLVLAGFSGLVFAVIMAIVLPVAFFQGHLAAQRARIVSLVDAVVMAQLDAHHEASQFMAISFQDDISDIVFNVSDDEVLEDYAIEAVSVDGKILRVQAWPRPSALKQRTAAPVSYFVEISSNGEIVRRGWLPQRHSVVAEAS